MSIWMTGFSTLQAIEKMVVSCTDCYNVDGVFCGTSEESIDDMYDSISWW